MQQTGEFLIAHSIALSTVFAAAFAFAGMIVGWTRKPTTYAIWFAIAGGVAALGVMSALKLGGKLGL